MTHREILAGIDEAILRLQGIRAVLNGEANGIAGSLQAPESNQSLGGPALATSQSGATISSKEVTEGMHIPAARRERDTVAKWSLY